MKLSLLGAAIAGALTAVAIGAGPATDRLGFTLDGEPVDSSRIVRFDDRVFVLDRDNTVAFALRFDEDTAMPSDAAAERSRRLASLAGALERGGAEPNDRRRLGVGIGRPDATTAAQLGFDRDSATLITGVSRGFPAERAGLRRFDIVVGINGSSDASQDALRRTVRTTTTGDLVLLEIIRAGERRTVGVTVAELRNAH